MGQETKYGRLMEARQAMQKSSPALTRMTALFDAGSFAELDTFAKAEGNECGVITGWGYIDGNPAYAFAQDVSADGGAVGRVHAAKIARIYDLAVKTGAPVIGIYDSKGAKLREGGDALDAYGLMMESAAGLSGVVPQISLVLGVCAGTAAMVAASADFVVLSKEAELFLTPPYTAKAQGETLEDAGTAMGAMKAGVASLVADSEEEAIAAVRKLVSILPVNNLSNSPMCEFTAADAGEALRAMAENPGAIDLMAAIEGIADAGSVLELAKDFGTHARTALGTLGGMVCGFVGAGDDLCPDACDKIASLMNFCDAFQIPVVTLVASTGFKLSSRTDREGGIRAAARLGHVYARSTCPKIAVVAGYAIGPVYIALAGKGSNTDLTIAWPGAVISALKPETAVTVLWEDRITAETTRAMLEEEYCATLASPFAAAADGRIADVIDPAETWNALLASLDMLAGKRVVGPARKHSNLPL